MRGTILCVVLAACGGAGSAKPPPLPGAPAPPQPEAEASPTPVECAVSLDSASGEVRYGEARLVDLEPETVARTMGEPNRVEATYTQERFEEHGFGDAPPTSTMVPIEWRHTVYDALSLALETARSHYLPRSTRLRIFFENERRFDNVRPPEVLPRTRGGCALVIDGRALDTTHHLVPAGTDHRTGEVELLGATFSTTSHAGHIDRLYLDSPGFRVDIYLDNASTQRAAYAEIQIRRR